jgi:hypothetical protein
MSNHRQRVIGYFDLICRRETKKASNIPTDDHASPHANLVRYA